MTTTTGFNDDYACAHCGSPVPPNARMCRSCGADADCGWNEDADDDYYEDEFDYDEFVAREFPEHAPATSTSGDGWTKAVMVLVIVSLLLSLTLL